MQIGKKNRMKKKSKEKERQKKSFYVTLYPKIDSRQENTNEHASDLRNNETT